MSLPLLLGSMLLVCAGVAGWLWLCGGMLRPGWRGVVGRLAVQVSALCLVYGFLRGQPMPGLFMAMFPPLSVVFVAPLAGFAGFLSLLAWAALPYAGAALVVSLVWRPLRAWSLGVTGGVALVAAALLGEGISREAMCRAAAALGADTFARHSLSDSLTQAPSSGRIDPHAVADIKGQKMAWSYAGMAWYPIPAGGNSMITAQTATCD